MRLNNKLYSLILGLTLLLSACSSPVEKINKAINEEIAPIKEEIETQKSKPDFSNEDWGDDEKEEELFNKDEMKSIMKKMVKFQELAGEELMENRVMKKMMRQTRQLQESLSEEFLTEENMEQMTKNAKSLQQFMEYELQNDESFKSLMDDSPELKELMENPFDQDTDPENHPKLKARIDCHPDSVSADLIENIKVKIIKEHMDDDKLLKAKSLVNEVCLRSMHVRDICEIFMLDDAKLAFAKFAFGRTADPENFKKVADALSFKDNKRKLQAYVIEQLEEENSSID